MAVKRKLGILLLAFVFVVSIYIFFVSTPKESHSIVEVLNSVSDEYEIQSKSVEIGGPSPFIFINVRDQEDVPKVREYLAEHLSYEDVKDYSVDVFSFP